ncbi:MAG: dienelactone hydrolase family protein [Sedimentisphaerales bacterium]
MNSNEHQQPPQEVEITIDDKVSIKSSLNVFDRAEGIVLFAHGSGSGRFSPRNRYVAGVLEQAGIASLLIDLLTEEEERVDLITRELRFDIDLLTTRVVGATKWLLADSALSKLKVGYFGASTGASAALVAAAELGEDIAAVVSRGGRPDLAGKALPKVKAPTLLIVGGNDFVVIDLNKRAMEQLAGEKELVIVPGAGHLFEEPGTLQQVAQHAANWFGRYLYRDKNSGRN